MAPEWTSLADRLERKLSSETTLNSLDSLKALDIYALGIILCDLICNPKTAMESMRIDDAIRSRKPSLPKGYKLEGLVESELLLKLVDPDSERRPTIEQVQMMLNNWKESLEQ
jgi:hypothetical protein